MLAIAAVAAFSCAEEIERTAEPEKVFEPKVISAFTDDDVTPDTKTSLSGVNILWADTDNIKGYDLTKVHTSTSTAVSEGGKKADFTFATVSVEDDLYYIAYPAENVSNIDDDYVYATIPSVQTATAGSFANGANVAIANGLTANPIFKNVGGLLSIIINNDDVTSVKLSANEELTGSSIISTGSGDFAEAVIDEGVKSVTLSGTIANGTEYYAVVYPGTYTGLKIEVTNTSGQIATYTNPNSLTVARNANLHIATLTIPDGKWVTPTKGSEYIWTLASGDLGSNGSPSAAISGKGTPAKNWSATYTFADATKYIGWESARGVQFGSGSHGCSGATFSTTEYSEYVQSVAVNAAATGTGNIAVSVNGVSLKYSSATSQTLTSSATEYVFVADALIKGSVEVIFSGGNKAFYLKSVKINPDTRTAQILSFPQAAYAVELSEGTFESPVLSGANTTVTYSSNNEDVATVNATTGLVTLKTTGIVNITATAAANATYKSASASYELTVNPGPSSIASVIAASTSTSVYTQGVVAQVNHKGFILTDGTDNVLVYQNAVPTVVAGQAVKVSGTRGINNNVPQINGTIVVTPGATGQTINRTSITTITSANAKGHTYSTYVSLAGELIIDGSYVNVTISGSSVKGSLYQLSGSESFTGGSVADLNGAPVIVTGYIVGSTNSYLTIAVVDIVLDPDTPYLKTTPASDETIDWDDDVYGAGNAKTITIVQNGNATGYTVSYTDSENAWSVTDNGSGTVTVYPKAANTSTTTNKTLTLTITHNDDALQSSEITLNQKKQGGPTWTRVTSVSTLLAGGTFIMGYEATAKSGVIVPLRSKDCGATTSANGILNSGTTNGSSTDGTINMSDLSEVTTSDYEVYISASSTDGCINIQRVNNTGNYYGSSSDGSSKNTARLYSSGNSNETNLTPEFSSESDNQFKLKVTVTGAYKYFKYNTGSPRFAFYNSAGEKIVFYKKD